MSDNKYTKGNGSIVIIIEDISEPALQILRKAVFSAFEQLGVPYCVEKIDSHWCDTSRAKQVLEHSALLFPQSGTMRLFSDSYVKALESAVKAGLGIICYEKDFGKLPLWFMKLMLFEPESIRGGECSELVTADTESFITWTRMAGESVKSDKVFPYSVCNQIYKSRNILVNEYGDKMLFTGKNGSGKLVCFPFGIELFTIPYLGHACGADDIFLRSVVFAARKPFCTWGMPEAAGLVIDDCSGSYDHFGYVDIMENHGWIPYLGLFTQAIDEVAHEDIHKSAKLLNRRYHDGTIEIGFHALRYNKSFCFDHLGRRPLTEAELQERFALWDKYLKDWEITHSSWAHPHFGEVSRNALPYYQQRGIKFLTYLLPFDAAWFDVPSLYEPLPPMPPYGHGGYYFTELPDSSIVGCNCVLDKKSRDSAEYVVQTDYLWGYTPFWNEADSVKVAESALTLATQIRRGIDSGFYGEGATHEQRIACLRKEELNEIFSEAEKLLSRYDIQSMGISSLLDIMKKRSRSNLVEVMTGNSNDVVSYSLSGPEALGTELQVYYDEPDGFISKKRHIVTAVDGVLARN